MMEGLANRWTRAWMDGGAENVERVCTIREVEPVVVAVVSNTAMMQDVRMPECIEEVLQEWGCTWMWRSPRMQENKGWLKETIHDGTRVVLIDRSYI